MSTTNQILEKAKALSGKEEKPENKPKPKRRGVWVQVGEPFIDPESNVGVVITERIRGRPEFSLSFMHFDDHGGNRYIAVPIEGEHKLEDVVYSLTKHAMEVIEKRRSEFKPDKPKSKPKPRREKKTTGLSEVVQEDRAKAGEPAPEGKTAKKKKKGKR